LHDVIKIVRGPCSEKLANGYTTQSRMRALELKLCTLQIELSQPIDIRCTQSFELVEQLIQRFVFSLSELGVTVEWIEGPLGSELEHYGEACHPIATFPMVQMSEDIIGTPCARSFCGSNPRVGETAKEHVEHRGRAIEYGN